MKNLITEIWEIRGMVDNAIVNKDADLAVRAYKRFMQLSDNKAYLDSFSASTKGRGGTFDEKEDKEKNWNRLAFNLNYQVARAIGENVIDLPYGKAESLLDVIWLSRAMFDDCINASSNKKEEEKILIRLTAVQDKLSSCYHEIRSSYPQEKTAIMAIRQEIEEARWNVFGEKATPSLFDTESSCY